MADISGIRIDNNEFTAKDNEAVSNITRAGTTFTATRRDGTTFTFDAPPQAQADWSENDSTNDAYIKNKPSNVVSDANYVHTDNNYTNNEKSKLSDAYNATTSLVNELSAKNLLKYPYHQGTRTMSGVTFMVNPDGSITTSGIATAANTYTLHTRSQGEANDFTLKNGTYILSGCPDGGSSTTFEMAVLNTYNSAYRYLGRDYGNGIEFVVNGDDFSNDESNLQVQITVRSGADMNGLTFKPMIRLATISNFSFAPYAMTNQHLTRIISELQNQLNKTILNLEGEDLTVKYAEEIALFDNKWEWIANRISNGNYTGLHIGDYIPFECSNGYILNAQIAGIDTYRAINGISHHIDFISKELWGLPHQYNKVNLNNGNANQTAPFMASDLYHWINSLSGNVPNSASDTTITTPVDYTAGGIYYYLPEELKDVIASKSGYLSRRYNASGLLTADNNWDNRSMTLWLPTEFEVNGAIVQGSATYGALMAVQYPLFKGNVYAKTKALCTNNARQRWWTSSTRGGDSASWTLFINGVESYTSATAEWYVPVCFRIGG